MTAFDIEATARRYFEVHGEWAWLEVSLIADRHYANGDMRLFGEWVRVGKRLDVLLPWTGAVD